MCARLCPPAVVMVVSSGVWSVASLTRGWRPLEAGSVPGPRTLTSLHSVSLHLQPSPVSIQLWAPEDIIIIIMVSTPEVTQTPGN